MNIEDIIARAAPPPHRADASTFEPIETDADSLAMRHQRLTEAFGSREALRVHVESLEIPLDEWLNRFRNVRLVGPEPPWALSFRLLLQRLSDEAMSFTEVRHGARDDVIATWPRDLQRGPNVLDGALDYLAGRIGHVMETTLAYEQRLGTVSSWTSRFERSPVLAYALGQVFADWNADTTEIIQRAAADCQLIAREFFDAEDPGALIGMESGLGDPHNGGRSVAILRFERGSVVYKPKDLRIATAVGEIGGLLQAPGIVPPEMVLRNGYAWERLHEPFPIHEACDADAFYQGLGAWLALLQALGAMDFWFDNLIAEGRVPRFIDFETVVQPAMTWPTQMMPLPDSVLRMIEMLPGSIGILPLQFPTSDGQDPTDIGCLTRPGTHRTPLFDTRKGELATWDEDRFAPYYADTRMPADAADHFDAFEDGYLQVGNTLRDPGIQKQIIANLKRVADAPIRVIRIDTWTCYRQINNSLLPVYLSDAAWREAALYASLAGREGITGEIREAVVGDFRRLDVPLFQTRLDSRDLGEIGGGRCPDFYRNDAITSTGERLQAFTDLTETECTAWLRSNMAIRVDNPPWRQASAISPHPASPADLLSWADEIASDIESLAIADDEGAPIWLVLIHDIFSGVKTLGVTGFDLLSGRAGIARSLLILAKQLNRPTLAGLARETLAGAAHSYLDNLEVTTTLGAGHVVGCGGLIAALADDQDLRPLALDVYEGASSQEVWMKSGGDFVSGLAGWRDALCRLGKEAQEVHGTGRDYAPSAKKRLARWLDPDNASILCADRQTAARFRMDREQHGSWFASEWLDDRHNLSGVDGLPALAVRFVELAEQEATEESDCCGVEPGYPA